MNTLKERIQQLKEEKNAVILAHYYAPPEVQEIADYIGDSFYLSKLAVKLDNPVLVFCGVSFMGESAKLLNPENRSHAGRLRRLPDGAYGGQVRDRRRPGAVR